LCTCFLGVQQNRQNTSTPTSTVNQSLTKNLSGLTLDTLVSLKKVCSVCYLEYVHDASTVLLHIMEQALSQLFTVVISTLHFGWSMLLLHMQCVQLYITI
jgi:hypothetical protein